MLRFLEQLKPLHDDLGPLMFQFEYLNKGCFDFLNASNLHHVFLQGYSYS